MKMGDAFPKRFLTKEDVDPPILCEIDRLEIEMVRDFETKEDEPHKIVYLRNASREVTGGWGRGIVLNPTNARLIVGIRGEDWNETDTDDWAGTKVVLWNDMSVQGPNGWGGIRFRMPKDQPEAVEEQPPIGPTPDDVPF